MGHKNLYDVLQEIGVRPTLEYGRLMFLFFEQKSIFYYNRMISLAELIESTYFFANPVRGSATSFKELFVDLNLPNVGCRIEELFLLCELLLAFDPMYHVINEQNDDIRLAAYKQFDSIKDNIDIICSRSNHEIVTKKGKRIIVEMNKLTSHAVELTDDSELNFTMIEYNHYALKGHLEDKKKVLLQIGNYIEPILKDHVLKNAGFGDLESDAGFLLNNFHIRHNNKEGKKANDFVRALSDEKLEEWYDKTYDTVLSVIIINEQINTASEVKQLKNDYKWKG